MSNENEGVQGKAKLIVIQEESKKEFETRLNDALIRGAKFLPETFQYFSTGGSLTDTTYFLCVVSIPPESI